MSNQMVSQRLPETLFTDWLSRQATLITALVAAIPFGAQSSFLELAPPGKNLVLILTSVLCAASFLIIFWSRHDISWRASVLSGAAVLLLGLACVYVFCFVDDLFSTTNDVIKDVIYAFGLCITTLGISLLCVGGYTRNAERQTTLNELAPYLDRDQWAMLQNLAKAVISVANIAEQGAQRHFKVAFQQSANYLIFDTSQRILGLTDGSFELRPFNGMTVFNYFFGQTKSTFFAMAYDDLDFWESREGKTYLELNKRMVGRKINVKRVLVITDLESNRQRIEEITNAQRQVGIDIYVIEAPVARELARGHGIETEPDFGLLDGAVLAQWSRTEKEVRGVDVDPDNVRKHVEAFEEIKMRSSRMIPVHEDKDQ